MYETGKGRWAGLRAAITGKRLGVGSNCRVIGIRGVYEVVLGGIVITIIILHLELRNLIDKGDVCNGRFIIHRRAIIIIIIMILHMKPSCYQPGLEVGEAGATPRGHTNTTTGLGLSV